VIYSVYGQGFSLLVNPSGVRNSSNTADTAMKRGLSGMEMDSRVGQTRIKPDEDICKAVIDRIFGRKRENQALETEN
jgi:hypothetical protein